MLCIVDEIKYVVDQMRLPTNVGEVVVCNTADYTASPYFYFGTKQEITRRLIEKDLEQSYKYPAIILEMPFKEDLISDVRVKVEELRFLFVTRNELIKTDYRTSYELNIKPILYPMIERFEYALGVSENVDNWKINEKVDAPYYGDGSVYANEYWDIVFIKMESQFIKSCKKLLICQ